MKMKLKTPRTLAPPKATNNIYISVRVMGEDGNSVDPPLFAYIATVIPRLDEHIVINTHAVIGHTHAEVVGVCHVPMLNGPKTGVVNGKRVTWSSVVYIAVTNPELPEDDEE